MKKGFTLTEMLVVISLLGILVAIVFSFVNKQVDKYDIKLLDKQEKDIVLSAKLWASDNEELLPNEETEVLITYEEAKENTVSNYGILKITYGNLITENYIDRAINPVTKKEIEDDEYYILIRKSNKTWTYELVKNE